MKKIIELLLISSLLCFTQNAIAVAYNPISTITIEENNIAKKKKRTWKKIKKTKGKHGFGGILTVIFGLTGIFIGLKLLDIIAWSWLWVLSPLWISVALVILIILYVMILFLTMPKRPMIEAIPEEEIEKK